MTQTRHRFLFLDVNCTHIQPTRALYYPALRAEHEVVGFGPGLVDDEKLFKGVQAFIDANGPFDGIIASPLIFLYGVAPYTPDMHFYTKYMATFASKAAMAYIPQLLEQLKAAKLPRIGLIWETDLYDMRQQHIDQLQATNDFYIGFGPDLWKPKSEMIDLDRERFGHIASDDYWHFVRDKAEIYCSVPPHIMAENEFFFGPLSQRKLDWSVIGMNYVARQDAAKKLREMGVSLTENAVVARTYGRLKRFGIIPHELQFMQVLLNHNFRYRLGDSRFSFTCGLPWDMQIRKFFEIPAAGCVLVCKPCTSFENIGFMHGENAFKATPKDLPELHDYLTTNPDIAQKIATKGQDMVFANHSIRARGQHLGAALRAIAQGCFKGAKFVDGQFEIRTRI